ncbi:MAG: glycosyltransferase family 9 protein [bacterium]|nr:glycosyltransferase family 9 protein [bacterium]
MQEEINKVLVIRLSSLGDLVILSSLVEFLYRKGKRIHLVLYEEFADLYEEDNRIEKLIVINRTLKGKFKGLKSIREEEYDLVVDAHRKIYPFLLSLLSRAKHIIRVRKNSWERRMAVLFKRDIRETPLYELFVKSVEKYISVDVVPKPKLIFTKKPEFDLPNKYAVLVPGASKWTKRWPLEYYLELGKKIVEKLGLSVVVIGKERLIDLVPTGFINLQSNTTLRELLYILKNASFVVSNDTGPAHMAAAVGTPLFVIFGPTIPEFGFRPAGEGFIKLFEKKLPCRPCSLHGLDKCPMEHFRCMKEIKPEEVFSEIERFYSGRSD